MTEQIQKWEEFKKSYEKNNQLRKWSEIVAKEMGVTKDTVWRYARTLAPKPIKARKKSKINPEKLLELKLKRLNAKFKTNINLIQFKSRFKIAAKCKYTQVNLNINSPETYELGFAGKTDLDNLILMTKDIARIRGGLSHEDFIRITSQLIPEPKKITATKVEEDLDF